MEITGMDEQLKIYLRAEGGIAKRFSQIKQHLGVKNDTEVLRTLINWYWREHSEKFQPRLEHFNLNQDGVVILDRQLDKLIQVYFRPNGIFCEWCQTSMCEHIEFALSLPRVQKILREKGWKPRAAET